MKSLIKRIGSRMVRQDLIWKWVKGALVKGVRYLERERRKCEEARRTLPEQVVVDEAIEKLFPDLHVWHGVLQGISLPGA